jgi:hypothetical protein
VSPESLEPNRPETIFGVVQSPFDALVPPSASDVYDHSRESSNQRGYQNQHCDVECQFHFAFLPSCGLSPRAFYEPSMQEQRRLVKHNKYLVRTSDLPWHVKLIR